MNYLMVYIIVSAFLEGAKWLTDVKFGHSISLAAFLFFSRVMPSHTNNVRRMVYHSALVLSQEELEDFRLILTKTYLHAKLRLGKSCTNIFVLLEEHTVKGVRKSDHSSVLDHVLLLDANHVLCSCLLENVAYKLRVASCYEDELKFTLVLLYHLSELLPAYEFTTTFVVFKNQEIALSHILFVKFLA
jgi:hypothetical protein